MPFQVTSLCGGELRIAAFRPRGGAMWRNNVDESASNWVVKDVLAVSSTESGHYLLIQHGDELMTIRDFARNERMDFVGVFRQKDMTPPPDRIEEPTPARQAATQSGFDTLRADLLQSLAGFATPAAPRSL